MKNATKNGIDYIITATNEDNDRQIEQMVGKAMCAYANLKRATERPEGFFFRNVSEADMKEAKVAFEAEYEATIRCIAMFVEQPTSYICGYVIARCSEEFGI